MWDRFLVAPQMRLFFGVLWIVLGIIWLLRSNGEEAAPDTPQTVFAEPKMKAAKWRGWETGTGVGLIAIGLFYVVAALFSHRW